MPSVPQSMVVCDSFSSKMDYIGVFLDVVFS